MHGGGRDLGVRVPAMAVVMAVVTKVAAMVVMAKAVARRGGAAARPECRLKLPDDNDPSVIAIPLPPALALAPAG